MFTLLSLNRTQCTASASLWVRGKQVAFAQKTWVTLEDIDWAYFLSLFGGTPAPIYCIGKPLRDSLLDLFEFSWPFDFRSFQVWFETAPFRMPGLLKGLDYPLYFVPLDRSAITDFELHCRSAKRLEGTVGVVEVPPAPPVFPVPETDSILTWAKEVNLVATMERPNFSGAVFYWNKNEQKIVFDGGRVEMTSFYELRSIYTFFARETVSAGRVGDVWLYPLR